MIKSSFLKETINCYLYQNYSIRDIKKLESLEEQLYKSFKDSFDYLFENDPDVYENFISLPKLSQISVIKETIDNILNKNKSEDDEPILEFVDPVGITAIVMIILTMLARKPISKGISASLKTVGEGFKYVASKVKNVSTALILSYNIANKNFEICYKNCGMTREDIDVLHYFSKGAGDKAGTIRKAVDVDCLAKCYITYYIDHMIINLKLFADCLKAANAIDSREINKYVTPELFINYMINKSKSRDISLSSVCYEHLVNLKKFHDNFDDVVKYVFETNDSRAQAYALLNTRFKSEIEDIFSSKQKQELFKYSASHTKI